MTAIVLIDDLEPRRSVVVLRNPVFDADARAAVWAAVDELAAAAARASGDVAYLTERVAAIGAVR